MRLLGKGDVIYEGETIVTADGATADIQMADGSVYSVQGELFAEAVADTGKEAEPKADNAADTSVEDSTSSVEGRGAADSDGSSEVRHEISDNPHGFYRVLRSQDITQIQFVDGDNGFAPAPILSVSIVGGYNNGIAGRTGGYNEFIDGRGTHNPRLIEPFYMPDRSGNAFEPELRPFDVQSRDEWKERIPDAYGDNSTVVEGSDKISGNVLENDRGGNDALRVMEVIYVPEVDGAPISVRVPETGKITVDTQYGELTIESDGSWEYVSDPFETHPLPPSEDPLQDIITYIVSDADGDTDSAQLIIDILDTVPAIQSPVDSIVDEDDLQWGTDDEKESVVVSDELSVTPGEDPVDTRFIDQMSPDSLTSGGLKVLYEVINNGHTLRAYTEESNETVFTVDILNPYSSTGEQRYEFTLEGELDHELAEGENALDLLLRQLKLRSFRIKDFWVIE